MRTKIYHGHILYVTFPTRKELILSLCRPAEFYECANSKLRNHIFSHEEFLDNYMKSDGQLVYDWGGFNIPGTSLARFFTEFELTDRERQLQAATNRLPSTHPYYLIATTAGDSETLRHELAHAHYGLNPQYRRQANALVRGLPIKLRKKITATLAEWGYAPQVMADEIQAYLATSGLRYLRANFCPTITAERVKPFLALIKTVGV